MRIGIAIDNWKLDIFKRNLTDAGFGYSQTPGVTADTIMLYVVIEDKRLESLKTVVIAANAEAATFGATGEAKH